MEAFETKEQLGRQSHAIVVFDEQYSRSTRRAARRVPQWRSNPLPAATAVKYRFGMLTIACVPSPTRELNAHRESQQPRNFFNDGQTKTHAHALRALRIDLVILVEDSIQLVGRNADACIAHSDGERSGPVTQLTLDLALIGVFQRVANQVLQQLIEQGAIGRDNQRSRARCEARCPAPAPPTRIQWRVDEAYR